MNLVYAYVVNNNPKSYTEVVAALKDYKPASVKRTYFTVMAEIKKANVVVDEIMETAPLLRTEDKAALITIGVVIGIALVAYEIITKLF